jgi:riboflavin transporter FmnP
MMSKNIKPLQISARQIVIAVAFGIAAAIISLTIKFPIGQEMFLDPGEIFVTLGAALSGPIGGIIVGLLKGLVYAPERNIPSHILAGFIWGIWYLYMCKLTVNRKNGKWIRIALWVITIPIYYYVLLLPLYVWIYASTITTSFAQLFMKVAPAIIPEMIMTIIVTAIILAILPKKFTAPTK